MAACRKADLVTVTTPALAEQYGKHGRVRVVPNCIPESWLKIPRPDNPKPVVGWTGVVGTHPGDLEAVGDGVKLAVETAGAIFRSVGNDHPANVLGIAGQRDVVPWVDFSDYPHQTSLLDVGIVPLAETPFNEAKSWLKGLEYAALGIPFVASPTGPYHALNREGAGVLAHGPHRWREALISLLTNRKVADEYGQHGRDTASRWTVEGNSWRWLEAWDRAVKLRGQW
jgi:glycosyltransferase involved in cell wall biosynthesis